MDANVQVVKEITKALGDGVDKLTPVATEIVRQYQLQQLIDAIVGFGMSIFAIVVIAIGFKTYEWAYEHDLEAIWCIGGIFAFIAMIVGIIVGVSGFEGYVAPISGFIRDIASN